MLRYAHRIEPAFEKSFLGGLRDKGISLPEHWQTSIHLLNLSALLDCLKRTKPTHKNRCEDIQELIKYILEYLSQF